MTSYPSGPVTERAYDDAPKSGRESQVATALLSLEKTILAVSEEVAALEHQTLTELEARLSPVTRQIPPQAETACSDGQAAKEPRATPVPLAQGVEELSSRVYGLAQRLRSANQRVLDLTARVEL